jgi:hypothetical protein
LYVCRCNGNSLWRVFLFDLPASGRILEIVIREYYDSIPLSPS